MSKSGNPELPILITMGEPAGIGPEVALAAFDALGGRIGAHPLKRHDFPDDCRDVVRYWKTLNEGWERNCGTVRSAVVP